ncbi:MAG: hypothetical protein JKY56_18690 [Kofleriaceae bacterium]|nr:hypothetical protein [Kofleriaceae bacterium]
MIHVVALGFAVLFLWAYIAFRTRFVKILKDAPRCMIKDFRENEVVKIVGTLHYVGEPLVSPLTGRACAYYEIGIYKGGNAVSPGSLRMNEKILGVEFEIDDGTGRVVVDPSIAVVCIVLDSHTSSGMLDDPTERQIAYLEAQKVKGRTWIGPKELTYREGILEEGEIVAVMGTGSREVDPHASNQGARGYRDAPATRWRMQGHKKQCLVISDKPETVGNLSEDLVGVADSPR